MNLFQLYLLFVRIGAFTFGGGYAMIPLFQTELVNHYHFMTNAEFANFVALAQVTPGPVGLNAATYIGYLCGTRTLGGFFGGAVGGVIGTLGVMTPSLILVTLAAYFIHAFRNNAVMKAVLSGIRPATLGLIAAAVIFFAETSVFSAPLKNLWNSGKEFGISWQGTLIFLAVLIVQLKWKLNPIPLLLGTALLSFFLYRIG